MVLVKSCVLNVMAGRQTMDRRIINPQPAEKFFYAGPDPDYPGYYKWLTDKRHGHGLVQRIKPKYKVGDEVYVAEGCKIAGPTGFPRRMIVTYLADGQEALRIISKSEWKLWRARKHPNRPTPGRSMYKSLARTFMTITGVGVERVRDINLKDIIAEGISPKNRTESTMHIMWYNLWDSIHGEGAAADNKWVFWYRWELLGDK